MTMRFSKIPWPAIAKTGLAGVALAAASAQAQKLDNSQSPPRATIVQVTDQRTADDDDGCTIDLKFTGGGAEDALCARNLRIDDAVDEYGDDLRTEQPEDQGGIFSLNDKSKRPLVLEILLKNPPRKSATIKELQGDTQLFIPTDANGGLVTLPDFSARPEGPVENSILERSRIQLVNLTPPDFKSLKENERGRILNIARKAGLADENIRLLKKALREAGQFSTSPDPAKALLIYRKDPENMIVQAEIQDAHGNRIAPNEIDTYEKELFLLSFDDDLPKNIHLVLRLAVPGAIKDCSFDFHDIALP